MEIVAGRVGDLQPKVERMTFDGADRLSQTLRVTTPGDEAWTTNAFYFDPNGNLVSNGMGLAMGYDHDNRVTNVVNEGTANAYEYDGLGDRVTRHSLQGTRHFVLDRGAALHNVLMEADTNGLPVRYYIWGARGLLAQVETNGAVYYFHADEQGSTLALTDTNGAVVAEYAYSPYGEVLDQAGGMETPYTFGGGYGAYHEGGSLYYIKARYYAADLRRWLTKDPIGLPGGLNLYAYCHGDPVNFIDPWGWEEKARKSYWIDRLPSDKAVSLKIDDNDLLDTMGRYYANKLRHEHDPRNLFGTRGDTDFHEFSSRVFVYDGKVYTGEELNYIGVGMGSRHFFGLLGTQINDAAVIFNNAIQGDFSKPGEHRFMWYGYWNYTRGVNRSRR